MKGLFSPKNPQKYKGNPTEIVYRSSWELKLMNKLDTNPNVISWGSETIIIPYRSPLDNKIHRYYVDFIVTKINKDGKKETVLIEVKPKSQTQQPKKGKKITKKFISESKAWVVNQAKWKACEDFCKNRNWSFQIFTEKELGINY